MTDSFLNGHHRAQEDIDMETFIKNVDDDTRGKLSLWNRLDAIPVPVEDEFDTFETHFVRKVKHTAFVDGCLPANLILPDVQFWRDVRVGEKGTVCVENDNTCNLVILVPSQWATLKDILTSNLLPSLSTRLMQRIEQEQAELRRATSVWDDLLSIGGGESSKEDMEIVALLVEYVDCKQPYITMLRQVRRILENVHKQSMRLCDLMKRYRRSEYADEDTI